MRYTVLQYWVFVVLLCVCAALSPHVHHRVLTKQSGWGTQFADVEFYINGQLAFIQSPGAAVPINSGHFFYLVFCGMLYLCVCVYVCAVCVCMCVCARVCLRLRT